MVLFYFYKIQIDLFLLFYVYQAGERNAKQVLSNGLLQTILSLLYLNDCGSGERPIDFINDFNSTWYTIAILGYFLFIFFKELSPNFFLFIASFSCCCGDTLASELGTVFFPKNKFAFHVTKWKKVPKGTNGGISFMGTLASILGGLWGGLAYYATLKTSLFFTFSSKSNIFFGYYL